jgi:predicted nucleic acid-binding protein
VTKIQTALEEVRKLGIDSAPLIYFVERHAEFSPVVRTAIERAEAGELELVTSTVTLTEVLTLPFQQQADAIAETYRAILLGSPYTRIFSVDPEIAELAARLRANYRIKTPDAIQLAVSIQAGCEAFLTNDRNLRRVQELSVLVLIDLI